MKRCISKCFSCGLLLAWLVVPATVVQAQGSHSKGGSDSKAQAGSQAKADDMPVVIIEDFENGRSHWETTDDDSWEIKKEDGNTFFSLNKRKSDYQPKVRSPHNIALHKTAEVSDFELTFKVRHALDTGGHRDCCVFFGYQDPTHFYYVHLGAKPDPVSGQIMIVDGKDRKALSKNKNKTPWTDDWHTIKLVRSAKEGTIDIYFDDMENKHMTVVDKTFGKGRIGIGSFDDIVQIDDVVLKGK